MNKRGQFFLIAAIAIISMVVGFAVVTNYTSIPQTSNIFNLKSEILIESAKVINYGVYNQYNFTQMQNTLTDFSERYINESKGDNLYFIFGNATNITFMAYQASYSNITINNVDYTNLVGTGKTYSQTFNPSGNNVNVSLNGNQYLFILSIGENFDFILSSNNGGQNYTVTSNGY